MEPSKLLISFDTISCTVVNMTTQLRDEDAASPTGIKVVVVGAGKAYRSSGYSDDDS